MAMLLTAIGLDGQLQLPTFAWKAGDLLQGLSTVVEVGDSTGF